VAGAAGRRWVNDDERAAIIAALRKGGTSPEVARQFKRDPETIRVIGKRYGLTIARAPGRWPRWRPDEIDLIVTMARDGHGIGSMAKALNRPRGQTGRIARQNGITITPTPIKSRRLRFELSAKAWARLDLLSAEICMRRSATARMVLMACLRDPWLLQNVLTPTAFVEGEED
jgi:hypothetical protein